MGMSITTELTQNCRAHLHREERSAGTIDK